MKDITAHFIMAACPFCGAEPIVKKNRTIMVNCTSCTAATFQKEDDELSAIKAWNKRVRIVLDKEG